MPARPSSSTFNPPIAEASKVLPFRISRIDSGHTSPKPPSLGDIQDLLEQVRSTTNALSLLLLKEKSWKRGLAPGNRELLDGIVVQFCNFCETANDLLQLFFNFSESFITLSISIRHPGSSKTIAHFAESLLSQTRSISTQISSLEGRVQDFTRNLKELSPRIPKSNISCFDYLHRISGVIQRLDAFWRAVATYLEDVLARRIKVPHYLVGGGAERPWSEYKEYLSPYAMGVLMRHSDALKAAAAPSLKQKLLKRVMELVLSWFRRRV